MPHARLVPWLLASGACLMLVLAAPSALAQDDMDAEFTTPGGNDWWVEVYVDAEEPLEQVEARADAGEWVSLSHTDWGSWAKSFHVPEGSLVEFRATSTAGATSMSEVYRWPSGERTDEEPQPRPTSFSTPGGNEWWVEVYVDSGTPVESVDTRVDGGEWIELERTWWGAWASSVHVPRGSLVQFQATLDSGETVLSGEYRWPEGEQVSPPSEEGELEAWFAPRAGNAWWVETYAVGQENITSVHARADGGSWHAMDATAWDTWAVSFHAPQGTHVEFRATGETGAMVTSQAYEWPGATPLGAEGDAWPREGSYAFYERFASPAPPVQIHTETLFVHHDGTWRSHCSIVEENPGGTEHRTIVDQLPPPSGPTPVTVGENVSVGIGLCGDASLEDLNVTGERTENTYQDGVPVTATTYHANRTPDWGSYHAEWETETGLTLAWGAGTSTSWRTGSLVDTNAPMTTEQ